MPDKDKQLWLDARQLTTENQLEKALLKINEAIKIDSLNPTYISERGVIFYLMGRKEDALLQMNLAVELEPNNPYRYASRGQIKSMMNMLESAIEDYEICVEMDPNDPVAYNNLGLLLESYGRKKDAQKYFDKCDEIEGVKNEKKDEQIVEIETNNQALEQENPIIQNETNKNTWQIFKSIIYDKEQRKEFKSFVKNGFKLKQ